MRLTHACVCSAVPAAPKIGLHASESVPMKKLFFVVAVCGIAIPAASIAKSGFPEADAGSHDTIATDAQQTCPKGQTWDAHVKKCVSPSSINYNSSKSNTGNVTLAPPSAPKNNPN
jgi:hypothetical protein